MIDVLLVSPRLPPTDNRYCGEHAYTDTLLKYSPSGIRFYHYKDLMASDQVRKIKWLYRIGPRLAKWGVLPPDLWAEYLVSDFVPDILHIHGFSAVVRFPQAKGHVPVVLSTSTGSYSDLQYYLGWDLYRTQRARWLKRLYLHMIGAHDTSLRPERAERVFVWSQFSKQLHLDEGFIKLEQIEVINPGLPWHGDGKNKWNKKEGITFLFVGRDFDRKNGELVLSAFQKVRSQNSTTQLIIVGIPTNGQTIVKPGITHYHFLPRHELFGRIYPQADILVLPSKVEGFGLALLEAMSMSMPVIGVNAWAMREVVESGVNGFLISEGDVDQLIEIMTSFVGDPKLLAKMRQSTERLFHERFSVTIHNKRVKDLYSSLSVSQTSSE